MPGIVIVLRRVHRDFRFGLLLPLFALVQSFFEIADAGVELVELLAIGRTDSASQLPCSFAHRIKNAASVTKLGDLCLDFLLRSLHEQLAEQPRR